MWTRWAVAAALAFAAGTCRRVEPLPVVEPEPARGQPSAGRLDLPPASALPSKELADLLPDLFPGSVRYGHARVNGREVLAGLGENDDRPATLASVQRVGDKAGSVVVVVALEREKGRIRRVAVVEPAGDLAGLDAFRRQQERFLTQFTGLSADGLRAVRVVPGAEALCEALIAYVKEEAAALDRLFGDEQAAETLLATTWRIRPPQLEGDASPGAVPEPAPARSRVQQSPRGRIGSGDWTTPQYVALGVLCVTALLGLLLVVSRR